VYVNWKSVDKTAVKTIPQKATERELRDSLRQAVTSLLSSEEDHGLVESAANQLFSILARTSGLETSLDKFEYAQETITPNGKAISPNDAARCVLDFQRTAKFVRGIRAAIHQALKDFTCRPLEILYAGCGPFAPFAIAMAQQFEPEEIQLTLLDIHEQSLKAAEEIFLSSGCADYVKAFVKCDAAIYQHNGPFHVVIIEALQKALEKEPQVAMAMNLSRQLEKGGILIPEKITVDACLEMLRSAEIPEKSRKIYLGRLVEVSKNALRHQSDTHPNRSLHELPPVSVQIPSGVPPDLYLMLSTTITVFDSIQLLDYESGLTYPTFLHDLGHCKPGDRIEFSYRIGNSPGFTYRRLGD
jgi:hypothetical protein